MIMMFKENKNSSCCDDKNGTRFGKFYIIILVCVECSKEINNKEKLLITRVSPYM